MKSVTSGHLLLEEIDNRVYRLVLCLLSRLIKKNEQLVTILGLQTQPHEWEISYFILILQYTDKAVTRK